MISIILHVRVGLEKPTEDGPIILVIIVISKIVGSVLEVVSEDDIELMEVDIHRPVELLKTKLFALTLIQVTAICGIMEKAHYHIILISFLAKVLFTRSLVLRI